MLHDATVTVHHEHRATIGARFTREQVERVFWRNHFLLNWKHVEPETVRRRQVPWIREWLHELYWRGVAAQGGFSDALARLPEVLRSQEEMRRHDVAPIERLVEMEEEPSVPAA